MRNSCPGWLAHSRTVVGSLSTVLGAVADKIRIDTSGLRGRGLAQGALPGKETDYGLACLLNQPHPPRHPPSLDSWLQV